MSKAIILALLLGIVCVSTACRTAASDYQAKEADDGAPDRADHGCKVVMRSSELIQGGTCDWLFAVDVDRAIAETLQAGAVQVRYNVNDGDWATIPAKFSTSQTSERFRRYTANTGQCFGGGGPSLRVRAVAFVSLPEANLFDHNFEGGDVGNVLADHGNDWNARNLSAHCQ